MGQILSNPVVEKEFHADTDALTAFGLCTMQGWRMSMEDSHITEMNIASQSSKDHIAFYTVFDGHGGSSVAQFCGEKCAAILQRQENFKNGKLSQALIDAFLATDEDLLKDPVLRNDHSGCTATTILISKLQQLLICANSGDSRTVLSTKGNAKALSYDHKPTLASEKSRIIAAKGFVEMDRVNGNLALSRALGDFEFKSNSELPPEEQIVTCVPDVIEHNLNHDEDEFVVLACDGIWDCLSSQECIDLVNYGIMRGNLSLEEISSRIVDVCCAPTTEGTGIGCDNMSIVIVALLKENENLEQWFERIRSKRYNIPVSFAQRKRNIFTYYEFPEAASANEDEDPVFDVTLKKPSQDESRQSMEGKRSSGGPVDLFSLEALLGASGIQLAPNGDAGANAGAPFIHGSALSEMLASLSNAAAGSTEPEDYVVEEEEEKNDDHKIEELN